MILFQNVCDIACKPIISFYVLKQLEISCIANKHAHLIGRSFKIDMFQCIQYVSVLNSLLTKRCACSD